MHAKLPHFEWDSHKLRKRKYLILPWIVDPTTGAQLERKNGRETLVFAQRHEANTMELFFDLFFVANLALFTQYHSIVDHKGFLTYVEFFGLLWGTWFSITLYDVRFALDSVYERSCKLIQAAVFVVFALVGSEFEPGGDVSDKKDRVNFRTLSYVLCASRALLCIQYLVVMYFVFKRKFTKLIFPLALNAFWYFVTTVVFGAMSTAFPDSGNYHRNIYLVWYVAMGLEVVCVLSISTIWRTLSFKLTHLAERMSLLTLIIMGEGIIGITKTISIIMAKAPDAEYYGLCLVILLIIFWLYFIYFDNTPRGHFGTIRQQVWAFLHFPLHLSIVGIVEGAQQLVRARYVMRNDAKFNKDVYEYCVKQHLDGDKLADKLNGTIEYFDFPSKSASNQWMPNIYLALEAVRQESGICSRESLDDHSNSELGLLEEYPSKLNDLWEYVATAIFSGTVTDKQVPGFDSDDAINSSVKQWQVAYYYFWGAIGLLSFTTILIHFLCRKSRRDMLTLLGVGIRVLVIIIAAFLGAHAAANVDFFIAFMSTTAVVPTAMACLFLIVCIDSVGRMLSNYSIRHTDKHIVDDEAEEAAHDHFHAGHEEHEMHGHEHKTTPHSHDEHAAGWYNGIGQAAYLPPTPGSAPIGYTPIANPAFNQPTGYRDQFSPQFSPPLPTPDAPGHARNLSGAAGGLYDNANYRSNML